LRWWKRIPLNIRVVNILCQRMAQPVALTTDCFWVFLTHLFFEITQDVGNLPRLYHAVFHLLRGPRPQDVGTPSPFLSVLTSESASGPGKGLHRQSNLTWSLHRLLATAIFISNYTVQLQCLQRAPCRRESEKSHFSTLNVGLARTGNRTRATCMAGTVARRSAIHFACLPEWKANNSPLSTSPSAGDAYACCHEKEEEEKISVVIDIEKAVLVLSLGSSLQVLTGPNAAWPRWFSGCQYVLGYAERR
jgi:hypothetical protein